MASARFANPSTASNRSSALANFESYLRANQMTSQSLVELVNSPNGATTFIRVMDRYALHLVVSAGSRGRQLKAGTVKLYYGNVKNWFYDLNPSLQHECDRKLRSIASLTGKEMNKKSTAPVKQAPPCTREDLRAIMEAIYTHAANEGDYADAALLAVMWHLLGRSSDVVSLTKTSFAVHPGGALTVQFERMKTSAQQGLSMFAAQNMLDCPVLAIAIASACDIIPSQRLFRQLPVQTDDVDDEVDAYELPLVEFLQNESEEIAGPTATRRAAPGIHAYINRLLRRVDALQPAAIVTSKKLSSHSFRRGAAQTANGTAKLCLQWIVDRGGWCMTSMNKAFEYIFNSTIEDQKVAKYLSGWEPDEAAWVPSIRMLDDRLHDGVHAFMRTLFHLDTTPVERELCFRADVMDMMAAVVIYHYPDVIRLQPQSLFQGKVTRALASCGYNENDIVSWSLSLRMTKTATRKQAATIPERSSDDKDVKAMLMEQVDVLKQCLSLCSGVTARLDTMEGLRTPSIPPNQQPPPPSITNAAGTRRRSAPKSPTDVWYEWFVLDPPLWETRDGSARQRFFDIRMVVAYIRLFLSEPYRLVRGSVGYSAEVLRLGAVADTALKQYLRHHNCAASSVGTIVKTLTRFERMGALDERKANLASRIAEGVVEEPTPREYLLPWKQG